MKPTKCSILFLSVFLFAIVIRCSTSANHTPTTLQTSSYTATYFVDVYCEDPNLTCKEESRPCGNFDQVIDAALLELEPFQNLTLNYFTMIIRGNRGAFCGRKPFDFSKYALKFNLFIIGNPIFSACEMVLQEGSIVNELVMEGLIGSKSRIISNRIEKIILDRVQYTLKVEISNVNNLQIANSVLSVTMLSHVENISISNSTIQGLALGSPKIFDINYSNIVGWVKLANFQLFSIRNSNWEDPSGSVSEFTSGDSFVIYNSTVTIPSLLFLISNITIEKINLRDGYFTDYLFQIIRVEKVFILGSTFYNNTISAKNSLFSLQFVNNLRIEDCDYSFNRGGFLSIRNDRDNGFSINYSLSRSKFNNNQLQSSPIFEMNGNKAGYSLYADSLDFVNNTNEISTCCFELNGGYIFFNNSNFISNIAVRGGVMYLKDILYLKLANSLFDSNIAYHSGGAFYISQSQLLYISVDNVLCERNYANKAGGCICSERYLVFDSTEFIQFKNNAANSYGNDIAYPLQEIIVKDSNGNLLEKDITQVYSGDSLYLHLYIIDSLNQSASSLENLYINVDNNMATSYQNIQMAHGFIIAIVQIIPSFIRSDSNSFNFVNLTISAPPQLTKTIQVEILPCPYSYSLKESNDGYSCVYIPLDIIIPTAIFGMISVLITLVATIYGVVFIIRKLMKLRKQEKAEKEIEQKFKDKEFIFGSEASESLLSHSINTDTERSQYIIPISEIDIVKKIGEGGMASVYYALWNRTGVAIKKLKAETDDEEFEKESILMSSLRHPSIVSCLGVSIASTSKYIVVEYMENGSLESAIYNSKQGRQVLKFNKKLNILIDIAKGMTYLHSIKPHKIVHRDLKSANVLLDKSMNAKVGDFGLSKVVSGNSTMTTNIGTLMYCSPEILSNQHLKEQSTKLDVYSFSIVMWELLFEIPPYSNELDDAMNSFSMLMKVIKGKRPALLFGNAFENLTEEFLNHNFTKKQLKTIGNSKIIELLTKYVDIMKSCWSGNPSLRPEFIQITDLLESIQQHI